MNIDPSELKFIDKEVIKGMARGPWANYWASKQEEKGRSFSGIDVYEAASATPLWAKKWAKKVADEIVRLNDKWGKTSIGGYANSIRHCFKTPPDYEKIGFWLGCQAAGIGISWTDDLPNKPPFTLKIPRIEFYRA